MSSEDVDFWFAEGRDVGKRIVIEHIAKWLAKDWHIVSQDTMPDIFLDPDVVCGYDEKRELQTMLWEEIKQVRRYELKELQSKVKKLEKKLKKIEEKGKEKK